MEFYMNVGGRQEGPFTVEELSQKGVSPESEVWTQGMNGWQQAGDVPELTAVLQRAEFEAAQQASRAAERQATMGQPYNPQPPAQQPYGYAYQAPPQVPLQQPVKKRGCMPWLVAGLILAVLFGAMVFTCPDKQDHEQAIQQVARNWVDHKLQDKLETLTGNEGWGSYLRDVISKLVADFTGKGTDYAISHYLEVKNYMVCSVGTISLGGKDKMVSLGIFGHVFTFDEQDLDVLWDKAWDDYWASNSLIPSFGQEDKSARTNILPDTIMGIEVPDEVDSLVNDVTDDAIRAAKEWAKQQFDEL